MKNEEYIFLATLKKNLATKKKKRLCCELDRYLGYSSVSYGTQPYAVLLTFCTHTNNNPVRHEDSAAAAAVQ